MAIESGITERILDQACRLGFDLVGFVRPEPPTTVDRYQAWLENGFHGEMAYLARTDAMAKRADLSLLQPDLGSVVVVGANYYTSTLAPTLANDPSRGIIASYAWGGEYHEWMTSRLHRLADFIGSACQAPVAYRAYVDTGPILERELAVRAGLGFVGKNTNVIHPRMGSWLFLGELLLDTELPVTRAAPVQGTCGGCTRCLDACPTGALVAPFMLDARRCISYLTIELKGTIPRELRPLMGNRIFGCDICQEVCPWNLRHSSPTSEPVFQPDSDTLPPHLVDLLSLDAEGFRLRFGDSAIARAKRRGLLRNVAVALGNWGHPDTIAPLTTALRDNEPLVRGHAAWALGQTMSTQAQSALVQALSSETDLWVQEEIAQGLEALNGDLSHS